MQEEIEVNMIEREKLKRLVKNGEKGIKDLIKENILMR
jgi:hypothetical protein